MKNKRYIPAQIEIIETSSFDVITTSCIGTDEGFNEGLITCPADETGH